MSLQTVNKYTRAGYSGKIIICPECKTESRVYHFSWFALSCQGCKQTIEKLNYLLKLKK